MDNLLKSKPAKKAWVVTVDMGYGHQRASYPLSVFSEGEIISANSYKGIPDADRVIWENSRSFYEFISRFKNVPFLGERAFDLYDKFQAIPQFYPKRDLSKGNIQLKEIYSLFEKKNWGKHLIDKLAKKKIPLVTTFFVTAMMAEYFKYPGPIFCVICDTDISRTWVPLKPRESRIHYFAPNKRVVDRLKLYGVSEERIFLTGFPLPLENLGDNLKLLKQDVGKRLINLDPEKVYISQYRKTINTQLGIKNLKMTPTRPLTITFAVGGAGAQRELGATILGSLRQDIEDGKIRFNLVAGVNGDVNHYFKDVIHDLKLSGRSKKNVSIIFHPDKDGYFKEFNKVLRTTDILWTKPSELSFYCALGLPIVIAPPIGSQEIFNQKWLQAIGSGMNQDNPKYTAEWLNDWLNSGWLAEAAMQGFLEAPKYGTFNIEKLVFNHSDEAKKVKMFLQY